MTGLCKVQRDPNGLLLQECTVFAGVKIGSFDCTANCPHNQNTPKEIQEQAFDLAFVRCEKIQINNQIKIEI